MDTLTATAAMAALTRSSLLACFMFVPLGGWFFFDVGTVAMRLAPAVRKCSYRRNLTIEVALPHSTAMPLALRQAEDGALSSAGARGDRRPVVFFAKGGNPCE
jgi:hypothetical protein